MKSSDEIKKGIIGTYFIFIVNIIVSLLFTPFLVNSLGKAEYGIYALLGAMVSSLMILDFGFGNAITRYVAQYSEKKMKDKEADFLGICFTVYSVIAIISLFLGIGIFFILDNIYSNFTSDEMYVTKVIYIFLLFNLIISFFIGAFNAYIQAKEKFRILNYVLLIKVLLRVIVLTILLHLGFKAITVVFIDTILNVISGLFYFLYSILKLKMRINFGYFNLKFLKEILSYSSFVFISNLADIMMWKFGLLIIGAFQGPKEVAIYSLGITIVSYFQYISGAVNGKLFPRVTQMITRNTSSFEISVFISKIARLQLFLLGGIVLGFYLFGGEFVILWLGKGYEGVYWVGLIIMFAMIPQSIQYTCVLVLRALKKDNFRSILQLSAMGLGIILGTLLLPYYYSLGMALGMAIALIILNWIVVNIHYSKVFKFNIFMFLKEIFKLLPTLFISTLLGLFLNVMDEQSWYLFIFKCIVFTSGYILSFWIISANEFEKKLFSSLLKNLAFKRRKSELS